MLERSFRNQIAPWGSQDEFDRMFDQFRRGWLDTASPSHIAMDVRETPEAFIIEADVPGMKKNEVEIEVLDNMVTVRGSRSSDREEKKEDYHLTERHIGSFSRSISIPGGFQGDKTMAKFENGVLTITLPKLEEKKARKIDVQVE
jgi:HSP20 family protein